MQLCERGEGGGVRGGYSEGGKRFELLAQGKEMAEVGRKALGRNDRLGEGELLGGTGELGRRESRRLAVAPLRHSSEARASAPSVRTRVGAERGRCRSSRKAGVSCAPAGLSQLLRSGRVGHERRDARSRARKGAARHSRARWGVEASIGEREEGASRRRRDGLVPGEGRASLKAWAGDPQNREVGSVGGRAGKERFA
jgi:hypothetical protein